MQEIIVELIRTANITQIIATGVIVWFFYNRLDGKIEKLEERMAKESLRLEEKIAKESLRLEEKVAKESLRLEENIHRLEENIHRLGEKVEDVDRRLCRIEGSLASHGLALFNQLPPEQKAQ